MSSKINIEQLEEYLKQAGLENGKLEEVLSPIKELNNQRRYGLVWEEPDNTTYGSDSAEQELLRNFPFIKEVNEHRIYNGEQYPDHLLIEGDNLHALKTMQYTHKNKIDVIYIDPPYNTGNTDFVYNDKYVDNEDSWRHSKWLSFMNKRLRLARELMTDEGVIFISIDDNEQAQLKLLCDQIFGEENFVSNIVWRNKGTGAFDSSKIINENEYILCYAKDESKVRFTRRKMDTSNDKQYKYQDDKVEYAGRYKRQALAMGSLSYSPSLDYPVTCPDNTVLYPGGGYGPPHTWRYSEDTLKKAIEDDMVEFVKTRNGWSLYSKQYEFLDKNGKVIDRSTPYTNTYTEVLGRRGTQTLKKIMGSNNFSYPKPVELVQFIVNLIDKPNATVLDFFAGSGTTAHAVMELNEEDGGNRQAIVITNNEINSSEEEDLLVEKGYVEPFTGSRRGTKKHSEWLEKVNEFKQTPEYLEFIETDEYKDLGIARAVTEQRINKVINGYTTPEGKEVEGLDNNNFYHFEVVLEPDLLDMDLNTYVLVKKTKDIIRIKEGVYTTEEDISTETTPAVKLINEDKEVIVVLSVRVTESGIEQLITNFDDSDKEHIIYTSYTGYDYDLHSVNFKELPKELLHAIKLNENN